MIAFFAGQFIAAGRADDLGDMRVGVNSLQLIAMLGQGIKEHGLLEPPCQVQVFAFSRQGVEVPEHFIHAAEFSLQDSLHVLVADALLPMVDPTRHAFGHRQRLIVSAVDVHVQEACHDFVISVEGSPDLAPLAQAIEKFLRERAKVTVLVGLLAIGHCATNPSAFSFNS